MRILPIPFQNFNIEKINHSSILDSRPKGISLNKSQFDQISFGHTAKNAEPLRELMNYAIPDLYSDVIVMPPDVIERFLAENIFSKNIKIIVKQLSLFKECLHATELKFYNLVKQQALTTPQMKLSDFVQKLAPEHNKLLLKKQRPIFENLKQLSLKMPEQQKQDFDDFMSVIEKKLNHEPVVLPFSAKEFVYKLQRISEQISAKNNLQETSMINKILQMAKKIPETSLTEEVDPKTYKSKVKRNKTIVAQRNLSKQRIAVLKHLERIRMSSSLKNNEDLESLFVLTRSKIYGIPVTIPFNRKSFIYELQKITDTLTDKRLANKMIQTALTLPTSQNDLSAFIVKNTSSSSEKIGYSMISGSRGNIEHLIPHKKKGKDVLENYAITTERTNNERGIRPFSQQCKKHPEIYETAQKQINRLIELHNKGVFKKIHLSKWYIINLAQRLYKMSPDTKKLIVDLSKLK